MSFYKVQNVLKKERKVIVYESYTGMQWVGGYCSMYSLYDMTGRVKPKDILELMDVPPGKQEQYITAERYLPYDPERGEEVEDYGIPFLIDDLLYHVWSSENRSVCVLDEYIKPFRKFGREKEHYIHVDKDGNAWVEIWCGSMPLAMIREEPVMIDEAFIRRMKEQAARMEREFYRAPKGVPALDFDEETGEIRHE